MRRHVVLALLVLLLVAVLAAACGGGAATTGGQQSPAGSLDGQTLLQERCTVCHNLNRVDSASYDRAGWEASVDRMIARGAQLSEEERAILIDYLVNR
jgi:cytochrome c5